jgi:hypothetical protein
VPATRLRAVIDDIVAIAESDQDQEFIERQNQANGIKHCYLTACEDAKTKVTAQ